MPSALGIVASGRRASSSVLAPTFGSAAGSSASNSHTFTGMALGAAPSADRTVIAVLSARAASSAPTSVTIGGVTAVIDHSASADNTTIAFARAVVPTGTTADVVVSWSGTSVCGAGVTCLTGASVVKHAVANVATRPTGALTIESPAGGATIAGSFAFAAVALSATWTGVTETWDAYAGTTGRYHSGGHVATAALGNVSPTVTWTNNDGTLTVAVSYGPS